MKVLAKYWSKSTPNKQYEVRRGDDGRIYCTCPAWIFSKKCRHLTEFYMQEEEIKNGSM